ncbi:hypothetical protein CHS0354_026174 [Potamilus streckersoni]|uniref:Protein SPEC3 n=1 Tax=Potamilus streckersoni TaxID=2493646 RepID=A0AAE0VSJ4_9BIVA|nr:hypothetical protein CHS0354_026174 [Potamilus streckersoni]
MRSGWRMGAHARGKTERIAVPAMPMPMAVICCVLNFLVPGFGTILAGLSVFCCSRNEDMACYTRCGSCCISLGIGLLQLLTLPLLLLGWIWSCIWGVSFLGMSAEYYHDNPLSGGTVLPNGSSAAHPQGIVIIQHQPQAQGYGQRQQFGQPYYINGPTPVPQPPPYQGVSNITPTAPPIGEGQTYPNEPPPPYDYHLPSNKH